MDYRRAEVLVVCEVDKSSGLEAEELVVGTREVDYRPKCWSSVMWTSDVDDMRADVLVVCTSAALKCWLSVM